MNWVMGDTRRYLNKKGLRAMVDFIVAGKPVRIFLWEKQKMIPVGGANACFTYKEDGEGNRKVFSWWGMIHFNMEYFGSNTFSHEVSHLQEHIRVIGEHDEEEIATAVGHLNEEFWQWFNDNFEIQGDM
ncbi:hypothetical protein KQH61_06020 [bacterium]|nr:hypothetical protein [bacterium]